MNLRQSGELHSEFEQNQTDLDFAALADTLIPTLDEYDPIIARAAAESAAAAAAAPAAAAISAENIPTHPNPSLPSRSLSSASLSSNNCSISLFCLAPYLPSLASATKDAAGDALSLYQAGNKSKLLLGAASLIAFLAAFELSGQSTKENLTELTSIFRQRRKPDDWPALSKRYAYPVTIVAAGMAAWCAFSEGAQAYDFVNAIGTDYKITSIPYLKLGWTIVTIGATAGSGMTKLLTDNHETWKVMWRLSSGKHTPFANTASRIFTPTVGGFFATVGGFFAVVKSIHDSVQAYSVIKQIFSLQSPWAKGGLAFGCGIDMISNFCFSGLAVTSQMDELFRYIPKRKFEPAKIAAFTLSLTLAVFLSYVKRTLNMGFYQDLATQDFDLKDGTIPNSAFELISWVVLVSEVMLVMASLNPQMIHWIGNLFDITGSLLNWVTHQIGSLLNLITQPYRPQTAFGEHPPARLNLDTAPLLAATEEGRASTVGLFAAPAAALSSKADDEFRIPSRNRLTSCPPCTLI